MATRHRQSQEASRRRPPATTPEGRELQLASMAYDLAERQILDGTASSQIITHFLKAGSTREQLEKMQIEHNNELLKVKREAIESAARMEELYGAAIRAMRDYQGADDGDPYDDPDL